ncbi:MAG: hypothetical protein HY801_06830 [Candidatus Lindowbacteria bacterium]|nr:hypothetical protein [Candidatus Lindowbacteria bacterium]
MREGVRERAEDKPDGFFRSIGELVRRMHSAGFWHSDLHTGNILVESSADSFKLWLVDLHAAGRSSRLTRRRRMADLAKLVFSLEEFLDEGQLREALEGYSPDADKAEISETLRALLKSADSLRRLRIRSRAKRCLRTSGMFVVESTNAMKVYRRRNIEGGAVLDAVRRHQQIGAEKGPELIKTTSKSALTAFSLPGVGEGKIFVKEFSSGGVMKLLESMFYMHRGKRAWTAGHLLQILGVPCAEPLALIEDKRFGLLRTSYLLMREITGAAPLNVFLRNRYFRISGRLSCDEIREKKDFIYAGALALRALHSRNIYQKDFSGKNVLVRAGGNGEISFYCVDSDSVQFPQRISLRRRLKNLAQLNGLPTCVTTVDRIRFFKHYFNVGSITPRDKILLNTVRLMSSRRFRISRESDEALRRAAATETNAYEDIASF